MCRLQKEVIKMEITKEGFYWSMVMSGFLIFCGIGTFSNIRSIIFVSLFSLLLIYIIMVFERYYNA